MRRLLPGLLAVLLLSACGLPLPEGVRSAGDVQPARDEPGALRVIPPGPQPGASPEEVVRGFLRAQSSPADDHGVARQFLAPGTEWDDEQGAVIYQVRRFVPDRDRDPATFSVRFETTARIEPTGAFVIDRTPVTAPYTVARMPSGEYRLTSVPNGLHLLEADRVNSFRPYDVYFLARSADGSPAARLVPDRVFLPITADPAQELVSSLLVGPTLQLSAAVATAVPVAARTGTSVSVDAGVVTVDLPEQAHDLDARERQRLSAQFVWTLVPRFTGVRLRAGGRPLDVAGAGDVQTREDWSEYDPAGVERDAPLLYVQARKLRSLDGALPPSEATQPGPFAVDAVAASPATGALGLLTRSATAPDAVRVGPAAGPFSTVALSRPSLGSPTWGPGDQGLWVLELGPTPNVCLLPPPGEAPRRDPCDISYERPPGAGPLSAIQVSRDGARVALVFGAGTARRLYVGRVVPSGGRFRIAIGPDPVAPTLTDVTDVAWVSGTELVVLAASAPGATQLVLWTLPVDGSAAPAVVQRPGLTGDAVAVAAAPRRPLVVSSVVDRVPRLYRDNGQLFRQQPQPGSAPAYPG